MRRPRETEPVFIPMIVLPENPPADMAIRMIISDCPGACSPREILMQGDGDVTITDLISRVRRRRIAMPADIVTVWAAMESLTFDRLSSEWVGTDCVTCHSRMTLSRMANGRETGVSFDAGCNDATTRDLLDIAAVIDDIAGETGRTEGVRASPAALLVSDLDVAIGCSPVRVESILDIHLVLASCVSARGSPVCRGEARSADRRDRRGGVWPASALDARFARDSER